MRYHIDNDGYQVYVSAEFKSGGGAGGACGRYEDAEASYRGHLADPNVIAAEMILRRWEGDDFLEEVLLVRWER